MSDKRLNNRIFLMYLVSEQFREVLYHGTVSEIVKVDVTRGRDKKDFGKGFYIAVSKNQAVGMMHKKKKEAVRRSRNKSKTSKWSYRYNTSRNKY